MTKIKTTSLLKRLALGGALLTYVVLSSNVPIMVNANTANQLRDRINRLQSEIKATQSRVSDFHAQAATLKDAIANFEAAIRTTNKEIELVELQLKDIQTRLKQTRKDLERQKDILRTSLREHYTFGNVRTIELLVDSSSFSEFFDQQEYLNSIRSSIQDSAKQVAELEKQLEEQEAEQKRLLNQQIAQRRQLEDQKRARQRLLAETQGQEALYRQRAANLEKQKKAADAALDRYIQSLINSGASIGPIKKGDFVAYVGNTGYSSGPHLHFAIYNGSSCTISNGGPHCSPINLMNQFGWTWPVPARPNPTQGYHANHRAIDIGTQGVYGIPAVAVADGEIIHRGCLGEGIFRNYTVIIRHNNGWVSRYVHMDPPANNSAFDSCRANYWPG